MSKEGLIVVLGSPNGPHGELPPIACARLERAIQEAHLNPDYLIACTGGKGPFNTTDRPHAVYAKKFLTAHGILAKRIVALVESTNTVEDAQLLRPVIQKHKPGLLLIVTSDFHIPRARYIFERVFPGITLRFSEAPTPVSQEEYEELLAKEKNKLEWHYENGISA